jgi:hypothetical protein
METITKKIPHPKFPSFVTTIRYIGDRIDSLKRFADLEKTKMPYVVLDPRTDQPYIQTKGPEKGQPLVVYKVKPTTDYAITAIREYVAAFEGAVIDGKTVEDIVVLLHEQYDVPIEVDFPQLDDDGEPVRDAAGVIVTVKKTITVSWAKALERKAYDRKTFDADPLANGSAAS